MQACMISWDRRSGPNQGARVSSMGNNAKIQTKCCRDPGAVDAALRRNAPTGHRTVQWQSHRTRHRSTARSMPWVAIARAQRRDSSGRKTAASERQDVGADARTPPRTTDFANARETPRRSVLLPRCLCCDWRNGGVPATPARIQRLNPTRITLANNGSRQPPREKILRREQQCQCGDRAGRQQRAQRRPHPCPRSVAPAFAPQPHAPSTATGTSPGLSAPLPARIAARPAAPDLQLPRLRTSAATP